MEFKKTIAIFFVLIIIFNLGLTAQGNQDNDVELLIKAFEKSGATMENYWLNIGLPYNKYFGDKEMLIAGNNLSYILQLPKLEQLQLIGNQQLYSTKGNWGKGTEVELQLKRVNDQSNDSYLIFRLKGNDSLANLATNYERLMSYLEEIQISPKINACIQGNINDTLDNEQQFVLIKDILKILEASEIERLDTVLVKSVSAYSPKLQNSIWTSVNKMNLQVATHVNSQTKKTILTLGTPIITIEY